MRVVVINLDRSPDRLAMFREQAEGMGLAFERMAAIDARTVVEPRGRLTAGEIACFESHRRAWKELVESGDGWLAVFEDDVVLAPALAGLLAAPEQLPARADLIKLEAFTDEVALARRHLAFDGFALHCMLSRHRGSAGYLISRRAAARLLQQTDGFLRPIDVLIFDPDNPVTRGLRLLQAVPALCIQEHFLAKKAFRPPRHESLIRHSGPTTVPRPSQLTPLGRLGREIRRLGTQVVRLAARIRKGFVPSQRMVVPFAES